MAERSTLAEATHSQESLDELTPGFRGIVDNHIFLLVTRSLSNYRLGACSISATSFHPLENPVQSRSEPNVEINDGPHGVDASQYRFQDETRVSTG
jgi:hypothetical protein